MTKEIAFICYPVTDLKRARDFYENIIGLTAPEISEGGGGNWVEYLVGDTAFALGKMEGFNPHEDGANMAFEVDDFDASVKMLKEKNITFKMEPMDTPVCRMAMIKDTEGNSFMIHKRK